MHDDNNVHIVRYRYSPKESTRGGGIVPEFIKVLLIIYLLYMYIYIAHKQANHYGK